MSATPRPWCIGGRSNLVEGADGSYVINCDSVTPENSDLIVRAVNSHEELVTALAESLTWLETYKRLVGAVEGGPLSSTIEKTKAAIAKAKEPVE